MIQFGPWEIPDQSYHAKVSSFEKSLDMKDTQIVTLDREVEDALITGSKGHVYHVTLHECECGDFIRNAAPCKHMIFLAMKLGYSFDNVPVFDPYAAYEFDVEELISGLENRWRNGQLTFEAFDKCVSALRSSAKKAKRRPKHKKDCTTETAVEDNQLTLEAFAPKPSPVESNVSLIGSSTSCCSHYRECSNSGECVVPDRDYASDCVYRKNLKVGRIFYGQHANGFSPDKYISYQDHVHSLSAEARAIFDRLLISILEYQRGVRSVIVRNSPYLDEIASYGLFSFSRLESNFPPIKSDQWDYQRLLNPVLNNSQFCSLFQESQAVRAAELQPLRTALKEAKDRGDKIEVKRLTSELNNLYKTKPSERTKEFLRQWLNTEDGRPMRDMLSEPYRLASIPPDCALYAEEFWHINFIKAESYDRRIYWNTPYYEDGILSVNAKRAEEERRIRLSPGYTPEDKQSLLSSLSNTDSQSETEEPK